MGVDLPLLLGLGGAAISAEGKLTRELDIALFSLRLRLDSALKRLSPRINRSILSRQASW